MAHCFSLSTECYFLLYTRLKRKRVYGNAVTATNFSAKPWLSLECPSKSFVATIHAAVPVNLMRLIPMRCDGLKVEYHNPTTNKLGGPT